MVARVLCGVALVALAGCVMDRNVRAPAGDFLTHQQLTALLSETRTVRIKAGKIDAMGVYTRDGTAQLEGNFGIARGTWRIYDNRFCTRYPNIRQGFETCFFFQQVGENTYNTFMTDGSQNATWYVQK